MQYICLQQHHVGRQRNPLDDRVRDKPGANAHREAVFSSSSDLTARTTRDRDAAACMRCERDVYYPLHDLWTPVHDTREMGRSLHCMIFGQV
jgi:hypothetical protein